MSRTGLEKLSVAIKVSELTVKSLQQDAKIDELTGRIAEKRLAEEAERREEGPVDEESGSELAVQDLTHEPQAGSPVTMDEDPEGTFHESSSESTSPSQAPHRVPQHEQCVPPSFLKKVGPKLDPDSDDPNRVRAMGDNPLGWFLSEGAGRYGFIDDRLGIPNDEIGGRCPLCHRPVKGNLKAWLSHCATVKRQGVNDLHQFMDVQLRAMIRNSMDQSEERRDRELAIRVAVSDFNVAQATKDEKAIAQAKFHHEQLEAAFRTQMLDERNRREQLLGDFE